MTNEKDKKNTLSSHSEGVFPACRKDGSLYFRASLTRKRKHISLGSFDDSARAHAAYLEAVRILSDPACGLQSYTEASPLSFEKWVCLANFRDNGIYFRNPIYTGHKMFYYYLSPHRILKFDMDDLFYFSSHKVMCRGNHYFVADYGLQVSISSRFGLKPYAIAGRDFFFLNGDDTDFRRENLRIVNIYHGVTLEQKNGQYCYTVRIHVKGNYIVGRYEDEIQAAIAYNKAADILRKKGVRKNFMQNFIEDLSPSRYAEIYSSIRISPRILSLQI
ncbi:MAG: hypothetical protein ACI4HQ_01095 [Acetatifactor sp.]